MTGHETLARRIRESTPAIVPYLTGGYPEMSTFLRHLRELSAVSPAVEIGIPFSDPMADGATIQESSQAALDAGTSLRGIIEALVGAVGSDDSSLVAMTYLNPLLAFGLEEVFAAFSEAGVAALVVPDLPYEESGEVAAAAAQFAVGLVQLVTPLTSPDRLEVLCGNSQGFVYAVTMTGTTGGVVGDMDSVAGYLDMVRSFSSVPVLAGFGIREASQVRALAAHCDGVIVGSAVIERIAGGHDPVAFVEGLKN